MSDSANLASDSLKQDAGSAGGRLTLLYVVALSTVALLSLGAQWLIQRQMAVGESDSRVINIAGRQRMLSQRIAKNSLEIDRGQAGTDEPARQELKETLAEWTTNHDSLRYGDESRGVPGRISLDAARLFEQIEPHFQAMREAASSLLTESTAWQGKGDAVEAIQSNEDGFLTGMDNIVSQFVVEAERRVARLRRLELAILACTLLVLAAEGMLIFRPAVNRIERAVVSLRTLSCHLLEAKEQTEQASEAKTRFLANVSHELRTPMTAVLGMTELARGTTDPNEQARYLSIAEEAAQSLLTLLNDLIDIARIDVDKLTLTEAPFSPQEAPSRVARLLESAARAKALDLRVIPAESATSPPLLMGDEDRLVQVLLNLVSNAIKATESGRVTLEHAIEPLDERSSQLIYAVSDTGIGIAKEDQAKVFETFTQLDTGGKGSTGGAGLGLAICQRIIAAMDGTIELESEPNVGTTFRVSVPLRHASPTPESRQAVSRSPIGGRRLSLLVVEDSEVNRLICQRLLEGAGHQVLLTVDGESAEKRFKPGEFDAVLLDLQLPGIDGAATADILRRMCEEAACTPPPMVCLSAYTRDTIDPAKAKAFDAFLAKPIRRAELLETLAELAHDPTKIDMPSQFDRGLLAELATAFNAAAPVQLSQLRQAIEADDTAVVRVVAHRLRGQVAYFDASDLERRLAEIEEAAIANNSDTVRRLADSALDGIESLRAKLVDEYPPASSRG